MHASQSQRKTNRPQSVVPVTALVAVALANVALASGPLFVRLSDVGPVSAAFWRITLATPVLLVAAFATGGRPIRAAQGLWLVLAVAGVAFALDLASWHIGIVRTTLANSTLFGNSTTLILPIYGFLVARAWPTRAQALALALAAIGGALLLGRSAELSSRHLAGDLFCLLAGALYTIYLVLMRRARERMAPLSALALSSIGTIPALLLLALALGEPVIPHNWTPLIALAVVSQLFGQGLMIYAIGYLPPIVVGIALLIQPIVAATLGWIVYGERLQGPDFVGAALVAAALVLVGQGARRAQRVAPAADAPKSE